MLFSLLLIENLFNWIKPWLILTLKYSLLFMPWFLMFLRLFLQRYLFYMISVWLLYLNKTWAPKSLLINNIALPCAKIIWILSLVSILAFWRRQWKSRWLFFSYSFGEHILVKLLVAYLFWKVYLLHILYDWVSSSSLILCKVNFIAKSTTLSLLKGIPLRIFSWVSIIHKIY